MVGEGPLHLKYKRHSLADFRLVFETYGHVEPKLRRDAEGDEFNPCSAAWSKNQRRNLFRQGPADINPAKNCNRGYLLHA